MNEDIFVLSTGQNVKVDLELDPGEVEAALTRKTWFYSVEGDLINPGHVVLVRVWA